MSEYKEFVGRNEWEAMKNIASEEINAKRRSGLGAGRELSDIDPRTGLNLGSSGEDMDIENVTATPNAALYPTKEKLLRNPANWLGLSEGEKAKALIEHVQRMLQSNNDTTSKILNSLVVLRDRAIDDGEIRKKDYGTEGRYTVIADSEDEAKIYHTLVKVLDDVAPNSKTRRENDKAFQTPVDKAILEKFSKALNEVELENKQNIGNKNLVALFASDGLEEKMAQNLLAAVKKSPEFAEKSFIVSGNYKLKKAIEQVGLGDKLAHGEMDAKSGQKVAISYNGSRAESFEIVPGQSNATLKGAEFFRAKLAADKNAVAAAESVFVYHNPDAQIGKSDFVRDAATMAAQAGKISSFISFVPSKDGKDLFEKRDVREISTELLNEKVDLDRKRRIESIVRKDVFLDSLEGNFAIKQIGIMNVEGMSTANNASIKATLNVAKRLGISHISDLVEVMSNPNVKERNESHEIFKAEGVSRGMIARLADPKLIGSIMPKIETEIGNIQKTQTQMLPSSLNTKNSNELFMYRGEVDENKKLIMIVGDDSNGQIGKSVIDNGGTPLYVEGFSKIKPENFPQGAGVVTPGSVLFVGSPINQNFTEEKGEWAKEGRNTVRKTFDREVNGTGENSYTIVKTERFCKELPDGDPRKAPGIELWHNGEMLSRIEMSLPANGYGARNDDEKAQNTANWEKAASEIKKVSLMHEYKKKCQNEPSRMAQIELRNAALDKGFVVGTDCAVSSFNKSQFLISSQLAMSSSEESAARIGASIASSVIFAPSLDKADVIKALVTIKSEDVGMKIAAVIPNENTKENTEKYFVNGVISLKPAVKVAASLPGITLESKAIIAAGNGKIAIPATMDTVAKIALGIDQDMKKVEKKNKEQGAR